MLFYMYRIPNSITTEMSQKMVFYKNYNMSLCEEDSSSVNPFNITMISCS